MTKQKKDEGILTNQHELTAHVRRFGVRTGPYLLEVECDRTYAGIQLRDRFLAFQLAETAGRSGVAKDIKLYRYHANRPAEENEETLIDYPLVPDLWSPTHANKLV